MTPEELRSLADEATPGPWDWLDKFVWGFEGPKIERLSEAKISASDARLIALAPDLALLCAEMAEELTKHGWKSGSDYVGKDRADELVAKLSELEAR